MSDIENTLKNNEFQQIPLIYRKGTLKTRMFKRYNKQRKNIFNKQQKQWTHQKVDKAGGKTINKAYTELQAM